MYYFSALCLFEKFSQHKSMPQSIIILAQKTILKVDSKISSQPSGGNRHKISTILNEAILHRTTFCHTLNWEKDKSESLV